MSNDTFKAKLKKVWGNLVIKKNGAVARHQLRVGKFKLWFKKFRKSDDVHNTVGAIFTGIMDGLVISGLLYYWIGFKFSYVFAFGAGWFFLKEKALDEIRKILASLTLVKIGR